MSKDYYIYIIECTNNKLYTGWTLDIEKRFNEHISGKQGAKFTRSFKPRKIAALWKLIDGTRGEALRIEAYIKSLSRSEKLLIVKNPEALVNHIESLKNFNCKLTVLDILL